MPNFAPLGIEYDTAGNLYWTENGFWVNEPHGRVFYPSHVGGWWGINPPPGWGCDDGLIINDLPDPLFKDNSNEKTIAELTDMINKMLQDQYVLGKIEFTPPAEKRGTSKRNSLPHISADPVDNSALAQERDRLKIQLAELRAKKAREAKDSALKAEVERLKAEIAELSK